MKTNLEELREKSPALVNEVCNAAWDDILRLPDYTINGDVYINRDMIKRLLKEKTNEKTM